MARPVQYLIMMPFAQNWRAAAAMLVSVPPTMPGLIHSINTNIHVGVGTRLFDIAYLLGVSASAPFPGPWFRTHTQHSNPAVNYCTVRSGVDNLFHALEAFPRS